MQLANGHRFVTMLLRSGGSAGAAMGSPSPFCRRDGLLRLGCPLLAGASRSLMILAIIWGDRPTPLLPMSTSTLLELFGGFAAACFALWFVAMGPSSRTAPLVGLTALAPAVAPAVKAYLKRPGRLASFGLLLLRLTIGALMIHHGQEKLADPQQFANTYVASLHLPFPLFFAYAAGFSELIGSWLVILGLFTPLGALALSGTMTVAAYQHISTAGFNIYVLELVLLYLGGSLALLFNGPGRFSFDAGIAPALLDDLSAAAASGAGASSGEAGELRAIPIPMNSGSQG